MWRWMKRMSGILAPQEDTMPAGLRDVCAEVFEGAGYTSPQVDVQNFKRDLFAFRRDLNRVVTKSKGGYTLEKLIETF